MTLKLNIFLQVLFGESLCLHVNYNSLGKGLPLHDNCSYFILFFCHYCLCYSSSSLKVRSKINLVDWQEESTSEVLHSLKFLQEKKCTLTNKKLPTASKLLMSFDQWQVTLSPPIGNILELAGTVYNITQQNHEIIFYSFYVSKISTTKLRCNYLFVDKFSQSISFLHQEALLSLVENLNESKCHSFHLVICLLQKNKFFI